MDLAYDTIPVFGGKHKRLYREAQLAYIVSNDADPTNHPIFTLDTDLGSNVLHLTNTLEAPLQIRKQPITPHKDSSPLTYVWKMFFDGASSREVVGTGLVLVSSYSRNYISVIQVRV